MLQETPLFYAAYYGHTAVCEALVAAGGKISHRNRAGQTALHKVRPPLRRARTRARGGEFRPRPPRQSGLRSNLGDQRYIGRRRERASGREGAEGYRWSRDVKAK